jgi:single-strand DNA-binding protein
MASRSLNKVMLIGNLTRDPELRYTPAGVPVCSFGLATNRSWTTQSGDQKEDAQFHQIVAWNRLAELCSQLLRKGRKIYVEGRLQYREWVGSDGNKRQRTEIIISDMMLLDSRRPVGEGEEQLDVELDKAAEYAAPSEESPASEGESAHPKVSEDASTGDSKIAKETAEVAASDEGDEAAVASSDASQKPEAEEADAGSAKEKTEPSEQKKEEEGETEEKPKEEMPF